MIIDLFKTSVLKLKATGLTQAEIARLLGLSQQNLYRKLTRGKNLDAETWERAKALCHARNVSLD